MAESKMPARIWATCNGMSTRLPDGKRQFIGGWSEDSDRPRAIEYVRADAVEELVKALEFYSGIYEPGLTNPNDGPWGVNSTDFGERARSALSRFRSVEGGAND